MNREEERELKKHLRPTDLKAPFQTTRLDEDRAGDKGRVITLRLNDSDLALLAQQKELLDTDIDGGVIKFFWRAGWNVIHGTIGRENLAWIASRYRVRRRAKPAKPAGNVTQNQGGVVTHSESGP